MFCSLDLDSAFLIYRSCLNVNCMLIGSHQRVADKALSVSVGGNVSTQVNSVRYLGVLIDLGPCMFVAWPVKLNRLTGNICISYNTAASALPGIYARLVIHRYGE